MPPSPHPQKIKPPHPKITKPNRPHQKTHKTTTPPTRKSLRTTPQTPPTQQTPTTPPTTTKTNKRKLTKNQEAPPTKKRKLQESQSTPKTKTKTSKEKKAAVPAKRVQQFNYRSNIGTVIKLLKGVKFTKAQQTELQKIPFWPLINALSSTQLKASWCRCYNSIVTEMTTLYNKRKRSFVLGKKEMKLRSSDVKLIFGIDCGKDSITTKSYARPKDFELPFYKQRCKSVKRLDGKSLTKMFQQTKKGKSTNDRQDLARVITLYLCLKLLMPTTGHTLSWSFLNYVDNLNNIKKYNWVEAIKDTLLNSMANANNNPRHVTGCVMLLLCWYCEHSKLLRPSNKEGFSRFMKWNLGKMYSKWKHISLAHFEKQKPQEEPESDEKEEKSDDEKNQVTDEEKTEEEEETETEEEEEEEEEQQQQQQQQKEEEEPDEQQDSDKAEERQQTKGDQQEDLDEEEDQQQEQEEQQTNQQEEVNEQELANQREELQKKSDIFHAQGHDQPQTPTKEDDKDKLISAMRTQMQEMEQKFMAELRKKEDQLKEMSTKKTVSPQQRSMVKRIKQKSRKQAHDLDFEYQPMTKPKEDARNKTQIAADVPKPTQGTDKEKEKKNDNKKEGAHEAKQQQKEKMQEHIGQEEAVTAETNPKEHANQKKTKPLAISCRKTNKVWHSLSKKDHDQIQLINNTQSSACVWSGSEDENCVYFSDICRLTNREPLYGNVIDAFLEKQLALQPTIEEFEKNDLVFASNPYVGRSYVFSTLINTPLQNQDQALREKLMDSHFPEAMKNRYIHFPVNHDNHWTIVVFDNADGIWRHYDSLRPAKDCHNKHFEIAKQIQQHQLRWNKALLSKQGNMLSSQECETEIASIEECPQETPHSNDCAIAVCNVINQYLNWQPVQKKLRPTEWVKFRAQIINQFLNDENRSWKLEHYQMLTKHTKP
ncbi:unnamed protein product [Camellia sinensis]